MSLQCHIGSAVNGKLCIFRKPSEIGYFSLNGERIFHDDDSQMKWVYFPPFGWNGDLSPGLNWDLNEGYSEVIKKNFDILEKGTPVLKWMLRHQEEIWRIFHSPKSNVFFHSDMSQKCHIETADYRKLCIFRKPSEIGYFSLDGERVFHDDDSQMKWIFSPDSGWNGDLSPSLNWDLNEGYSQVIKKNFDILEKGTPILMWMLRHQENIQRAFHSPKANEPKIDFVSSRGLLTKVGSTLYDKDNDWSFCASKFKSVIYMVEFETVKHLQKRRNETERSKLMTSWGAKFEQYMTCDTPDSEPNTSIPVNEREEYHIVLKGQLNGYTLLYNAEVDGKDPHHVQTYTNNNDDLKSTDCYIELKTIKNTVPYRSKYYRQKLQKWWLQSFIGGIPKLISGHRDDNGIIQKLETFDVKDIPEMAKGEWNKELCLKLCYHILGFVKQCVREDNPEIVYKFSYDPKSYCERVITCERVNEDDALGIYQILPEWFTSEFHI